MTHRIGMSGSTILSERSHFEELFSFGLAHIEIGEFRDRGSYKDFLDMASSSGISFGIHAPHFRDGSKYDLLEDVKMPSLTARELFVKEVREASSSGASYLLVHFPYFKWGTDNSEEKIEEGLQFLSHLQHAYDIPIVCEPKLGVKQSPAGIQYLQNFPMSLWEEYGLRICMDLGDYRLAAGDDWKRFMEPLLPFTDVVHLHNVRLTDKGYIWTPVHPEFRKQGTEYNMGPCIEWLAQGNDKFFIFEHTPHTNPDRERVEEGIRWVHELVT